MPYEVQGKTIFDSRGLPRCIVCGAFAPFYCDYEIETGKTCDAPLCGRCRFNMGVKDYCPEHAGKPCLR
ncbi:MAG: hypothetical protein ABR958_05105 [Dehalococcoidales bacterium]